MSENLKIGSFIIGRSTDPTATLKISDEKFAEILIINELIVTLRRLKIGKF